MNRHAWKLHPQPSSLKKAREALSRLDVVGKVVLDPFCGTGTLLIAAKELGAHPIGSDIEDWSANLRPGAEDIEFHWGVDALEAVRRFEHDILFTDPPNPFELVGGRLPSAYRDTGVSGAELYKMLIGKLNERNLMGRKAKTIRALLELTEYELARGRIIVMNLFGPWSKYFARRFIIKRLYDTYYIVMDFRR